MPPTSPSALDLRVPSSPQLLKHSKSTITHSRTACARAHEPSAGASHAPDSRRHHSLFGAGRGQGLQDARSHPAPVVHLSEDAVHPQLQLKHGGGAAQLHSDDKNRWGLNGSTFILQQKHQVRATELVQETLKIVHLSCQTLLQLVALAWPFQTHALPPSFGTHLQASPAGGVHGGAIHGSQQLPGADQKQRQSVLHHLPLDLVIGSLAAAQLTFLLGNGALQQDVALEQRWVDAPQLVPGVQLGGGRRDGDQAAVRHQDLWGETLPGFLKGETIQRGEKRGDLEEKMSTRRRAWTMWLRLKNVSCWRQIKPQRCCYRQKRWQSGGDIYPWGNRDFLLIPEECFFGFSCMHSKNTLCSWAKSLPLRRR